MTSHKTMTPLEEIRAAAEARCGVHADVDAVQARCREAAKTGNAAGYSEYRLAAEFHVDRMTIRRWLGKR